MPVHLLLVLDAGNVFESVSPLSCAGFVYCHCTGRRAVFDNTHGKDSEYSAEGCCTATTMALTYFKQRYLSYLFPKFELYDILIRACEVAGVVV